MDPARALSRGAVDGRAFRIGTVSAYTAAAKTVTVTLDGADSTLPCVAASYTVGSTVLVARDGRSGGFVLGVIGQPPAPPPPTDPVPPPPVPTVRSRRRAAVPGSSGTYRSGKWRPTANLYQGDYSGDGVNFGAAFYGSQLRGLGADTTKPYAARLTYRRTSGGVYAATSPTFVLLAQRARPAGQPTVITSATGTAVAVGRSASWSLPDAWTAQLLNGTAGGLGIYVASSSPYVVLAGPATVAGSMTLDLSYYA